MRRTLSIPILIASSALNLHAEAQYVRPAGQTLRELAQARGFHIGANFPNLYQSWREDGKSGPRRFDPEAAIAKDHFTIMTAVCSRFALRIPA